MQEEEVVLRTTVRRFELLRFLLLMTPNFPIHKSMSIRKRCFWVVIFQLEK